MISGQKWARHLQLEGKAERKEGAGGWKDGWRDELASGRRLGGEASSHWLQDTRAPTSPLRYPLEPPSPDVGFAEL